MRAKLGLLVAAAVVFVPGWAAAGEASLAADAAAAAGMLAPTFDEAPDQPSAAVHRRQARFDPRRAEAPVLSWRPSRNPPAPPLSILVALAAVVVLDVVELRKPDSERAPPRLPTV